MLIFVFLKSLNQVKMSILKGVGVALVTPFHEDLSVDYDLSLIHI